MLKKKSARKGYRINGSTKWNSQSDGFLLITSHVWRAFEVPWQKEWHGMIAKSVDEESGLVVLGGESRHC